MGTGTVEGGAMGMGKVEGKVDRDRRIPVLLLDRL